MEEFTVEVTDIYIRTRDIQLPRVCPRRLSAGREPARLCGADLARAGSIRIVQWNDASWLGHLGQARDQHDVDEGGASIDGSRSSESGECWLPTVAYDCEVCGYRLAEGKCAELQAGALIDSLLLERATDRSGGAVARRP